MSKKTTILFASFLATLLLPIAAHAASTSFLGPIISDACNCPGSAPGWGCILATFQNLISFAVGFATIIITIFIALAGFTYMTSGGSAEKRQLANKRLMNAVIGLLIVLCAYLLVDSIMKVIYNPHAAGFGPWNSILGGQPGSDCFVVRQAPNAIQGLTAANNAVGGGGVPGGPATVASGDLQAKICSASGAYRGTSTAAGPDGGNKACAWSVNNVLANAGISAIGGSAVSGMEAALKGGRGTAIDQGSAVCGDIVIEAGDGHVGICQNVGCSQVLSNSSSHATFSWISGPDFAPSYSSGIGRFYRVTN